MKNKKCHTVGTVPKSNRNTNYQQNRLSSKTLTYNYIHNIDKYRHGQANTRTKACRQRSCKMVDNQKYNRLIPY